MTVIPPQVPHHDPDTSQDWFSEMYLKHFRLMIMIASHYCDEPHDVEDVVSQSCVVLIRKTKLLMRMSQEKLRTYIIRTVKHNALNHIRKRAREKRMIQELAEDDPTNEQSNAFSGIAFLEEIDAVQRAIHQLPEQQQTILIRKVLHGETNEEIAERLGITTDSVRKNLERARNRIAGNIYIEGR